MASASCAPGRGSTLRGRWSAWADVDQELVDRDKLLAWLALGGRRIGLGDWRPQKSGGLFGRFNVKKVTELRDAA